MTDRPKGRTDLRRQALGSELMLYDQAVDQVHILNETAVQVWQLCDGHHDREAILAEMTKRYPSAGTEVLRADLDRVIDDFRAKGLLIENEN